MSHSIPPSRLRVFESDPIPRAVAQLAIPTVISQLINIVYNYADTWFVGRTSNPSMVAAMSVCMPVYIFIGGLANLFGVGGSSLISRMLGAHRADRARNVFAFSFYAGMLTAVLYSLLIYFLHPALIPLIGGNAENAEYISRYMFYTMVLGAIPTLGNVLCGHLVRSIGAAREAGFGMSLGGILNILLDPLFMFVLLPPGNEVTGAAIATLLSNTISFLYFIVFLLRHRDDPVLTLDPRQVSLADGIPRSVITVGIPAALQTILAMVSNIFANALVIGYGNEAVAGMGIAKKVNMIAFNTTMGLTIGILPLIGYNYSARNTKRLRNVVRFTGVIAFSYCLLCMVLFRTFSEPLVAFFIGEPVSIGYGSSFLKVIALGVPLASLSYLTNSVFQASGWKKSSFLLSVMRKGFLDIGLMVLLSARVGVMGVVWATPLAELISAGIATGLYITYLRRLPQPDAASHRL